MPLAGESSPFTHGALEWATMPLAYSSLACVKGLDSLATMPLTSRDHSTAICETARHHPHCCIPTLLHICDYGAVAIMYENGRISSWGP